jgi:NADH-quinone oxidoreductase subunit C
MNTPFLDVLQSKITTTFAAYSPEFSEFHGDTILKIDKKAIVELASLLKYDEQLQFILCDDITAVDWAEKQNRFSVVYHVFSLVHGFRLRIMCPVDEHDCKIDSVASVWKSASWNERETFDMYGIIFNNHPDMRRMYMPEEFEYHPLRKEFPVMGIPGSLPLPKK